MHCILTIPGTVFKGTRVLFFPLFYCKNCQIVPKLQILAKSGSLWLLFGAFLNFCWEMSSISKKIHIWTILYLRKTFCQILAILVSGCFFLVNRFCILESVCSQNHKFSCTFLKKMNYGSKHPPTLQKKSKKMRRTSQKAKSIQQKVFEITGIDSRINLNNAPK